MIAAVALGLLCAAPWAGAQPMAGAGARSTGPRSQAITAAQAQKAASIAASPAIEAARVQREISAAPALRVEAARVSPAATIEAPRLSDRTESPVAQPAAGDVRFRPLTVTQEREVRTLLSRQIDWPAHGAEKAGQVALFQGVVETAPAGEAAMRLKAVAAVDAPMSFDPARRVFEGRVQVGFVEIGATGAARALDGQFAFQVQGPVRSEPPVVQASRTAPPFEVIRVVSDDPGKEVEITVRSSVNPDGARLTLPVARPTLEVSITPKRIQGYGFETADIVLRSNARGARVQVQSDVGRIEPLIVELDEHGNGRAKLRSVSTGVAKVTARGQPFAGQVEDNVQFAPPWSFAASALLGGLAGGIVRKGTRWRTGVGRLAIELLVAVLTAAIVFALFALGVNVTGFALPDNGGELLVFAVAALGAFLGTSALGPGGAATRANAGP